MASPGDHRPSAGLVLVRIGLGGLLVWRASAAIRAVSPDGFDVERQVRAALVDLAAPVAWWGEWLLLWNPDATALLLRWCALYSGVGLLLGALARPAGWLAAVLFLHLWLYGPAASATGALLGALCAVACAGSNAGRRMGCDAWLDQRLPRLFGRGRKRSFLD